MIEQRTDEWHEQRKGRITGSNVGAILGVNPYKTADDVLREMVRAYHGAEREFQGNVATEYGTHHEAGAIAEFEMETWYRVIKAPFVPKGGIFGASPDGYVLDMQDGMECCIALIEVKCPYGLRKDENPVFKSITDQPSYYAQIQLQLYCTETDRCIFYQWAPKGTSIEWVKRDPQWMENHWRELMKFYDMYISELDNPAHLQPLRKEINTLHSAKLIEEYDELSNAIDRATERKKAILEELVSIADGRDADIHGRKLTKVEKAGSISYAKAIKKYAPDADLEPFRGKPTEYWRLT